MRTLLTPVTRYILFTKKPDFLYNIPETGYIQKTEMPVITPSTYSSPFLLPGGHLQSIVPALRRVDGIQYRRERINTPDDDFLDLDWAVNGSDKIAILSHGLEGNTQRHYILGMIQALHRRGWDALAWNYRGCSGEPNKKLRSYHSGETADLHTVLCHAIARNQYREIALIGFSLGGNVTLKYLGEQNSNVHPLVSKAVAFSVPCDLKSGALKLAHISNIIYMKMFLRSLHEKIRAKMKILPEQINDDGFDQIKTFHDFDNRYTAPIHGFKDADDYFAKCSSRQFIPAIRIPTLLVSARNDPFLAEPCFPYEEANVNPNFFFEAPESGGHTGFFTWSRDGEYWSETRTMSFLNER